MRGVLFPFVLMAFGIGIGQGQEINTVNFTYRETLDDNYILHWNFNSTHIVFKVMVNTQGYIGFGFSANGRMFPSDVIIGWLDGGVPNFADRHGTGYFTPPRDASQDWFLLDASEVDGWTSLTMIRELDTCDPDDMPITKSTMRVIYSYGSQKPTSEDNIRYHGPFNRSSKSVMLLQPPSASSDPAPLPDDVTTFDLLNSNFQVPARETYYACTTFKLDLTEKHHMIRVEPVIQAGHENLVHHMLIYYCTSPLPDHLVGIEYECYHATIPEELHDCTHFFMGWAIGGRGFDYPPHLGHSLGAEGDPRYFRLETHYDNPALRDDFVDSSGLRYLLTKQIRQYDAAVMSIGHRVSAYQIIPPYNSNFLSRGYCHSECLAEALGDQEIHVVANALHAHLLGRKLRARIIRNGVEIPFLQADENYDFNFQETSILAEERILKRGDAIIVECEYDSSGRTEITYGGLGTRNEMCLSFVFYYPPIPLTQCLSRPIYAEAEEIGSKAFFGNLSLTDWTNQEAQTDFQQALHDSDILNRCWGNFGLSDNQYQFNGARTAKVNVTQTYVPPDPCQN